MSLFYLLIREIRYRKYPFIIGCIVIFIIAITILSCMELFNSYNKSEIAKLNKKIIDTDSTMRAFEESYHSIVRNMGFTYRLIPSDQTKADFFSDGFGSKMMPYSIVNNLQNRKPFLIESIVPVIRKKIWWKEQGRSVVVCGIGIDSISNTNNGDFFQHPSLSGKIAAGYCIGNDLRLKKSKNLIVNGNVFVVDTVYDQRGSIDDITLWLNFNDAQKTLSIHNKINEIWLWMKTDQALDNNKTKEALASLVQGCQIIEMVPKSVVKEKSLLAAQKESASALRRESDLIASEQKHRNSILSITAMTGVIVGSGLMFLFSWANVVSRYGEIGLLRSIGFTSNMIFVLFLGRTIIMCLLGSIAGCVIGNITRLLLTNRNIDISFSVMSSLLIITTAVICTLISGVLPAIHAVNHDPVTILMKE